MIGDLGFRAHRRRRVLAAAAVVLAPLMNGCATTLQPAPDSVVTVAYTDPYVIDGDTLDAANPGGQRERIRILGINTPEDSPSSTECGGPAATAALGQLLTGQQAVILVRGPTQPVRDKYGRALGYVELTDGTDVGMRLIELGLAEELTIGPAHARQREYRAAQQVAADASVGIWGTC